MRSVTTTPTRWSDTHVPVDQIVGIPAVGDRGTFGTGVGILGSAYLIAEWGLPEELVLLNGDGHWWIALDYRRHEPTPTVVWIDIEQGQELQLAVSFGAFLDSLVQFDDPLDKERSRRSPDAREAASNRRA